MYACQWHAILWKIIYVELILVVHYLSALLTGIGILNINGEEKPAVFGGFKELFVDIYNTQTGKWEKVSNIEFTFLYSLRSWNKIQYNLSNAKTFWCFLCQHSSYGFFGATYNELFGWNSLSS